MIKSFAHKGLESFFLTGSIKGIQAKHLEKLEMILDLLDGAGMPEEMNFPGSRLHSLRGKLKDHWSVRVSGNWRVTFRFEDGHAHLVDYRDYH
ncbi:type II toxin-antitoxin system RelE/ParE family toxin [Desulfococcaceae bacterium OttesenSCG-928-F15]|nr:type II toxin-antitoxin system RelE/ParE family toxin [Desulfococcaceae bacterium OttesenSCG-928-F15]